MLNIEHSKYLIGLNIKCAPLKWVTLYGINISSVYIGYNIIVYYFDVTCHTKLCRTSRAHAVTTTQYDT